MSLDLLEFAAGVEREARLFGADEAVAVVSQSTHTSIVRRDGRVEQATEATSRGLSFAVLVDDRSSSHSTSDLRPDAVTAFLKQAIAATRWLEADPERRLAEPQLCGRGYPEAALEQLDPGTVHRAAEARAAHALALEQAVEARRPPDAISVSMSTGDGFSESARVMSNGFADIHREGWFSVSGDMSLLDGERRPEASTGFGTRFLIDLPDVDQVAEDLVRRAIERRGSGAIESGRYPMILPNRVSGRILGMLSGPLAGSSLHQNRSCLQGKLGARVASPLLTLTDDPSLPRGLSSRPWDGDGLFARPLPIIEDGVLSNYYVSVYYGRKLGQTPTTGSRSNWVVPPGERSFQAALRDLPRAIVVDGFLGGNSNPVTGDFSVGIQGSLYEHGERMKALSEMNMAGNLLDLLQRLAEVGCDPYAYGSIRAPWLRFDEVQFSGV